LQAHQAAECSGRLLVQLFPKFPNIFISIESLPLSIALSVIGFVLLEARLTLPVTASDNRNKLYKYHPDYIIIIIINPLDIQASES
jgi:hypothetical protein